MLSASKKVARQRYKAPTGRWPKTLWKEIQPWKIYSPMMRWSTKIACSPLSLTNRALSISAATACGQMLLPEEWVEHQTEMIEETHSHESTIPTPRD